MIVRLLHLPPVLFFVFLLAGLALHAVVPIWLGLPSFGAGMGIGCTLLVAGALAVWAGLSELRKHGVAAEPGTRPTALVTSGIFSISRNPLYLALLLAQTSFAFMLNTPWLIVSAALLGVTLDRFVVRDEERLLESAFGQEYLAYRHRVRRWL